MKRNKLVKRALISVSDKSGVVEFANGLAGLGVEIISTGGTAKTLRDAGLEVTEVSEITGFPEMMDGRVKTLHPKIHGALLGVRDNSKHVAAMEEHSIVPIDLVAINLYPFEETVSRSGVTLPEAVEQIDIGGPAMIRSASKNWKDVAVVTDPRLYSGVIEEMRANGGGISIETRKRLAALAFTRTSYYDLAISGFLAENLSEDALSELEPYNPFGHLAFIEIDDPDNGGRDIETAGAPSADRLPAALSPTLEKSDDLRYGENPHQRSALFLSDGETGIANAEQLQGKEMSFNNFVDAEAAWRLVQDFETRAVAIIKHTNPCGAGLGSTNTEAYRKALETDPVSAFGGIVALNRTVDGEVAREIIKVFTEVVVAGSYSEEAVEIFKKRKNLRVIRVDTGDAVPEFEYKQISGGFLLQDRDTRRVSGDDLKVVTEKRPDDREMRALLFAWTVCKHVKSNAIVIANDGQTVGVGAGQMNRVDSVRIAAMRAERTELKLKGSVLASDAFFPFRDNVDEAALLGVSAIIQPGGSKRDDESILAADEHGVSMVFTGFRHFKH